MKKIYEIICKIEVILAKTTLFSMVILIFCAAIARSFKHPINWAVDISTFLFAWSCFLSADVAWRENKLMSVDVIVRLFPVKIKRYIKLLNYFILILFFLYLIIFGFWLSYTTRARAFQGIPNFSYTWVTLSVPIGSILLLITTILKIKDEIQDQKKNVFE